MKLKPTAEELQQRTETLKKWLEAAQYKVYTDVLHVSKSGMSRNIAVYICIINDITGAPEVRNISWYVSQILDWPLTDKGKHGIKVGGCGMDMGFHLVYSLSCVLYRNTETRSDAGYKLKQEWL